MTDRNELHVSISKRVSGGYGINAMHDGPINARPVFPVSTYKDVIMLRTWDEPNMDGPDNGRYCALSAEDLWLVAQIKRSGSKREIAMLAKKLAGLEDMRGE